MKWLYHVYERLNTSHPLKTNCVLGFFIAAIGDIGCQRFVEYPAGHENETVLTTDEKISSKEFKWDQRRSLELGVTRAAVISPFIHFWYPFLTVVSPGTAFVNVLGRVCFDQCFGSPIVISLVFLSTSVLQGKTPLDAVNRLQEFGFATWCKSLMWWPFIHSINFSLVPPSHRVLFAHFASVYWNAVLSYYSNLKTDQSQKLE